MKLNTMAGAIQVSVAQMSIGAVRGTVYLRDLLALMVTSHGAPCPSVIFLPMAFAKFNFH